MAGTTANKGLQPSRGLLTFHAEGTEGGTFHSRKLHVPSEASGLTIGRGYDMKLRKTNEIVRDLTAVGVHKDQASKIAKAAGLQGAKAKSFIAENKLEKFEISPQSQLSLFNKSYGDAVKDVQRISAKSDTVAAYGKVDFKKLHPAIAEIAYDLRFNGDYRTETRANVQKHIANNDLKGLQKAIANKKNWPKVPPDRFKRRVDFINEVVSKSEPTKASTSPARGQVKPAPTGAVRGPAPSIKGLQRPVPLKTHKR